MTDTPGASAGVVVAGLALAAAFLPWTDAAAGAEPVGAGLAAVALAAFLLSRHGLVGRPAGPVVAALGSLGLAGYALYRLVAPAVGTGEAPTVGTGLVLAGVAGAAGLAAAAVDLRGLSTSEALALLADASAAAAVGVVGLVVGNLVAVVPLLFLGEVSFAVAAGITTVGFGAGLVLLAAAVLRRRETGWDYVDARVPTLRDLGYAVAGTVALLALATAIGLAFTEVGLPTAESSIEQEARGMDNPVFLLVLVPLSWLVIGPGEELVFRNLVQKSLYERFSPAGAVVVASVIFAAVHVPQYYNPNPVAMLSTLAVVFALSLLLGWTYLRTGNLVVPVLIHGTFNALQFALLYLRLTGA